MARAAGEAPNANKVFICSTAQSQDKQLSLDLMKVLQNEPYRLQVVCPGLSEGWGSTSHESAISGLQNFTVAVIIASTELFGDKQSAETQSAKTCRDALFASAAGKVLLLRRNLSAKELRKASPMGYQHSVDASSTSLEEVAKLIYGKVREVTSSLKEVMDGMQKDPRFSYGERQSTDDLKTTDDQQSTEDTDDQVRQYRYDVFICFQNEVTDWVKTTLLSELEDTSVGVKACVHYRDFRPGKTIIKNILESVRDSRNVVFVVSCGFTSSGWCSFEVDTAITHILKTAQKKNRKIIPILHGGEVPEELQIYQSIAVDDEEFWPKLKSVLKPDLPPS